MNEFNSKAFLTCSTVFLMTINVLAQYELKHQEIIDDLPNKNDFEYYLSVVERAVDYCARHENYMDVNLKFGLFMIDYNLRPALEQELPIQMESRLNTVFKQIDALTTYFLATMQQKNLTGLDKEATTVFHDSSMWLRPEKFNLDLLNATVIYTKEELEQIYGKIETYIQNVLVHGIERPSPTESDDCILGLLERGIRLRRSWPNCVANPLCVKFEEEGNEYAFSLTHRMLFMVIAHFYRKCVVFGEIEDREMMDAHCMKAFTEAQYIAATRFQKLDIIAEQITLCGMMGHAQFFRNYWLQTIAQFQTPDGCFMKEYNNDTGPYINETSDELEAKRCNRHLTSVALASISSVLRYILEAHFL